MISIRHSGLLLVFFCLIINGWAQKADSVVWDGNGNIILKFDSSNSLVKNRYGSARSVSIKEQIQNDTITLITEFADLDTNGDCYRIQYYFKNDSLIRLKKIMSICNVINGHDDTTSFMSNSQATYDFYYKHDTIIKQRTAVDFDFLYGIHESLKDMAYENKRLLNSYLKNKKYQPHGNNGLFIPK